MRSSLYLGVFGFKSGPAVVTGLVGYLVQCNCFSSQWYAKERIHFHLVINMSTKTLDQRIESRPGVLGGKPCIAGRRIAVEHVAVWHERLGRSADEIAGEYDLELADVYAALAYYFAHRQEIDQTIQEGEDFVRRLQEKTPSLLKEKLGRSAGSP